MARRGRGKDTSQQQRVKDLGYSVRTISRDVLSNSLSAFIQRAWPIINPVTPYLPNWHIDLICEYLTLITQHKLRRVIFNIPPLLEICAGERDVARLILDVSAWYASWREGDKVRRGYLGSARRMSRSEARGWELWLTATCAEEAHVPPNLLS